MRPESRRSMQRRLTLALATGAMAATMIPGAVTAGAPIGGCPTDASWVLVLPIHQPQAADKNGDGWLCRADFWVGPGLLAVDNVVRNR